MIHIVTVHFKSLDWIRLQHAYINANVSEFKLWYFIDEVAFDPWPFDFQPHFKSSSEIYIGDSRGHAQKLNKFAYETLASEPDDDIILFLDGDAFPIAPINKIIDECLSSNDFCAIVREENDTPFPHPSFAFCKLGFWRDNNLSWGMCGFDTGNCLLSYFSANNTKWSKILRSSSLGEHGLLFGVYGGLVYHHGAGFRNPTRQRSQDRWDRHINPPSSHEDWLLRCDHREIDSARILHKFNEFIKKPPTDTPRTEGRGV